MKLRVFQSGKGDCMLLTGADGRNVLIDGGMRDAYSEHVAPALGELRDNNETIDVVDVSHIDQDHISGVLQMMDDEVAWRIHEFQLANDNPGHKEPAAARPPKVKAIWHNAFHQQINKNTKDIEDMLAASAAILSGSENVAVRELAAEQRELVTSVAEAIQLTMRVSPEQLGIKVNGPADGKLMLVRSDTTAAIKVGGLRFRIIGPFRSDLVALRKLWNQWLKENQARLKKLRATAKNEESKFSAKEIDDIILPKIEQAESLSELLSPDAFATAIKLGQRQKVTTQNLASLMFFVEETGKTLLLTGDGHHEEILRGLEHLNKLTGNQGLHVNVLKVQHHGSEHNLDREFCRKITADNYLFCGNGEHENPDLEVIQAIADSRLGNSTQRSPNPEVGNPFKFWINCHSSVTKEPAVHHMKEVEKRVAKIANKSQGQMSFFFLKGSSFDLQI
jgi:beta-lactamase superfamily II metal-dependent hydrolase